jgi:hypothetical protein
MQNFAAIVVFFSFDSIGPQVYNPYPFENERKTKNRTNAKREPTTLSESYHLRGLGFDKSSRN